MKNSETSKTREPLITISKRTDFSLKREILARAIAILAALITCGVITILLTGDNPLSIYLTIFNGALGKDSIWSTLQNLAILLCISLAVTPAFRMRFWNIGAEGQALIGALAAAACMFYLGGQGETSKTPEWLLILLMILSSTVAGAIWGVIPAIFKAKWKTNETLFTLMMNYIAIQLVEFFLKIADKSGSNTVGPSLLKFGWFPALFGQKYLLNVVIAAILTVLMFIYLNYSKHGYELSVVGESENTAKYIGINIKKVIIRTMLISGALCGLTGLLLTGGTSHSIDSNLIAGRGFSAIMVSWLAKFNPFFMVLTAFLLVFLGKGAEAVSTKFLLNPSFSDILTGVILFFIIGCEFFIQYKLTFHFRKKTNAKEEKSDVSGCRVH